MASIARSADQRAIPWRAPGRRFSSARPSGSSSCSVDCSRRCETETASGVMTCSRRWSASAARTRSSATSARIVVAEIGASSVTRPRNRVHVREANAHGDRPADERLCAEPRGDPIGEVTKGGPETRSTAGCRPSADCAPADRARWCVRISRGSRFQASEPSFSPTAWPSRRSSERPGMFASCPMVRIPCSASLALVTGPTPHIRLDRQIVEERELGRRIDHDETVRLGNLRGDLGQVLGPRHPDRNGRPSSTRTRRRIARGDLGAAPKRCVQPATSAKASSIDIRSTSGVKSPRMAMAASPRR